MYEICRDSEDVRMSEIRVGRTGVCKLREADGDSNITSCLNEDLFGQLPIYVEVLKLSKVPSSPHKINRLFQPTSLPMSPLKVSIYRL